MKKIICCILAMMFLVGCSLRDVNVEKNENPNNENDIVIKDEDINNHLDGNSKNKLNLEIGEKFVPKNGMVKNGGYLIVDSANIYDDLKSAGIEEDKLLSFSLIDDVGNPIPLCINTKTGDTSVAYDCQTGKMINGWHLLKIHYTFENQSAESIVNDLIVSEDEKYADNIFTVGNLNVCNIADLNDNKTNYYCLTKVYFSLSNSIEYTGKRQPTFFECSNGEKAEFDIVYVFCCDPKNLYMTSTTGSKTSQMVDLKLGGDS